MFPVQPQDEKEQKEEAVYEMKNGVRYVKPYIHQYVTYAKGRWIHKNILDVLSKEFGAYPRSYWSKAIIQGNVLVNGNAVTEQYEFKNADKLLHKTHRKEPPVFGRVQLVGENDKLLAVNKPASLPMHSCGNYRHNSLKAIVSKEHLVPNQPELFLVHRLDRVTSGVVVMAKSSEFANELCEDIRNGRTKKKYLARVKGIFPSIELSRLREVSLESIHKDFEGLMFQGNRNYITINRFHEAGFDSDDSSRSHHQIKKEIAEDKMRVAEIGRQIREAKSRKGRGEALILMGKVKDSIKRLLDEQKIIRNKCTSKNGRKQNVEGANVEKEHTVSNHTRREEVISCEDVGYALESHGALFLKCPVGVSSFREGTHACAVDGKKSLSIFKFLGYNAASDTSLVECQPVTGRTHQLRVHLQLIGNPIANDPCYGGDMFFNDHIRKAEAVKYLESLKCGGRSPMLKIPYLQDIVGKRPSFISPGEKNASKKKEDAVANTLDDAEPKDTSGSIFDDICEICEHSKFESSQDELEQLLHCHGIWLHALKYEGKGWLFETEYPPWATEVEFQK